MMKQCPTCHYFAIWRVRQTKTAAIIRMTTRTITIPTFSFVGKTWSLMFHIQVENTTRCLVNHERF